MQSVKKNFYEKQTWIMQRNIFLLYVRNAKKKHLTQKAVLICLIYRLVNVDVRRGNLFHFANLLGTKFVVYTGFRGQFQRK
jgi:hypothetical protein